MHAGHQRPPRPLHARGARRCAWVEGSARQAARTVCQPQPLLRPPSSQARQLRACPGIAWFWPPSLATSSLTRVAGSRARGSTSGEWLRKGAMLAVYCSMGGILHKLCSCREHKACKFFRIFCSNTLITHALNRTLPAQGGVPRVTGEAAGRVHRPVLPPASRVGRAHRGEPGGLEGASKGACWVGLRDGCKRILEAPVESQALQTLRFQTM